MDIENLKNSISQYNEQLKQINIAISATENSTEKDDLVNLKSDIEQLIELTEENLETILNQNEKPSTSDTNKTLDDEYLLFMQEMEKEGAMENSKNEETSTNTDIDDDLKSLEGMKCQAPHIHSWGDKIYHNAMVCNTINESQKSFNEIQVRVLFTNPTHQEMLPCPYFLGGSCKFTDERCKFSHGEMVLLSDLKEYREPNFTNLKSGSKVLAKRSNNLWQRAVVKTCNNNECFVKFELNQEEINIPLETILPLDDDISESESSDSESNEDEENDNDWLVQQSLLITPPSQALGDWEKHTKGIGSKLMQQMGYVIGTGLGRRADGRLEPVQAQVLPAGKSLDHCMNLREHAGGDENLFSVEKRLKKIQKQQEMRNKKAYEKEKNKKDVFEFLNDSLTLSKNKNGAEKCKNKHRQDIKAETNRDLNVTGLKIEEEIRRVEQEVYKIQETLIRHNNPESTINKNLKAKLVDREAELKRLRDYSVNVRNEQNLRKDKKKLSVF